MIFQRLSSSEGRQLVKTLKNWFSSLMFWVDDSLLRPRLMRSWMDDNSQAVNTTVNIATYNCRLWHSDRHILVDTKALQQWWWPYHDCKCQNWQFEFPTNWHRKFQNRGHSIFVAEENWKFMCSLNECICTDLCENTSNLVSRAIENNSILCKSQWTGVMSVFVEGSFLVDSISYCICQ